MTSVADGVISSETLAGSVGAVCSVTECCSMVPVVTLLAGVVVGSGAVSVEGAAGVTNIRSEVGGPSPASVLARMVTL